ncbi:MAG: non-ribosomal peptide synthetase, partial [Chloroflexota bacterium]
SRSGLETGYVAPTTENETKLVEIWSQIFQMPEVGIHDNFFDLGGDSIISIQIVAKAKQSGLHFSPRDIFEQQTISQIALIADSELITKSEQGLVTGTVPLTPIQHWFFNQEFSHPNHWNQSLWLDVPADVNLEALQSALEYLSKQHDALRSHFHQAVDGVWEQIISADSVPLSLEFHDLIGMPETDQEQIIKDRVNVLESTLDLGNGPLLKGIVFALGAKAPLRLVVSCHHLVIDGVSWQPLLSDWETAYNQITRSQAVHLPPKTTSLKEWGEKLNTYAQSPALIEELEYWRSDVEIYQFRPQSQVDMGKSLIHTLSHVLSEANTNNLLNEVHAAYNTNVVDLLLTAWAQAFSNLTDSDTASVMMEGHGRESEIFNDVDLTQTVGWFTTHYPVHVELSETFDPGTQIKQVKELLRRIPNNGIGYGLLRYLHTESPLASQPEPAVLFNYLGQFDRALPASELFTLAKPLRGSYSPNNPRTHALEVNAYIRNGQLALDVIYNTSQFETETVQTLVDDFGNLLDMLIQHCLSSEAGGHTPSDFALADLTEEQFDRLSEMLNKLDGS